MLYLIGLGLGDAKDISVRGLEVVKSAKKVFLEAYTSILSVDKDALVSIICHVGRQNMKLEVVYLFNGRI